MSGYARLAGDSAIEFASGQITSLAASAHLGLIGSDAFIEDRTTPGSNSALTGLASIGAGALFALHDQASLSTTGALANDGDVYLDSNGGDDGSSLTLAGALTNSQELGIGNATLSAFDNVTVASLDNTGSIYLTGSGANQALLDVTAGSAGFGAAGVLSANKGFLALDGYLYGSGLSALLVATGLTNTGELDIGNVALSGSDKLTAETLSNSGTVNLNGNGTNQALLDVTTGAAGFGKAGTLTGNVDLNLDSAIEFLSGQISTIAASDQRSFVGETLLDRETVWPAG